MADPRAEPPIGMLAELTHRCPLRCPYCSNPLELEGRSDELSTAEWRRVFAEAAALGVLQLHLSGGEPAVRDDLEDLVTHARAAGLYVNLITSGMLLDEARIHRLREAGLDHLQLSIQGVDEETADRIGGYKGVHIHKMRIARAVREAGLPLTVNAVMHRHNIDRLEEVIALAVTLGAHRLEVAHVQYYGWALLNRQALMPTRAQLAHSNRVVERAREALRGRLVIDYVVPDYWARRPKPCMGGWGRMVINVTPSGRVLPCHAAYVIPGLTFPSVQEASLAWIWQESDPFRKFRGTGWMREPCRSCERREVDFGGCRCQAMLLTGDPRNADPACELSPWHRAVRALAEAESTGEAPFVPRRPMRRVPAAPLTPLPAAEG